MISNSHVGICLDSDHLLCPLSFRFHMLQAYPIARNLPFPDFFIPFAHLIWVPFYIWEHWTGLADPVEEAWAMKSWIVPISGVLILYSFFLSHKLSSYPTITKTAIAAWFGFLIFAPKLGFKGSPAKTYVRACGGTIISSSMIYTPFFISSYIITF